MKIVPAAVLEGVAGAGKEDRVMGRAQSLARRGVEAPVETGKHPGLCTTCVHDATCTFWRDPAQPVVHCEEFESVVRVEAEFDRRPVLVRVRASSARGDSEDVAPSRAKGLCRTCAHRDTCTFPASEAGVWHCEEYE